nr:hypothetical protein GTC16762_29350 [Pigmentibacter ruber]
MENIIDSNFYRSLKSVPDLLNDISNHIEFNGHLSNHNKHAVVALARLSADINLINKFYFEYIECTTYGCGLEPPKISKYHITKQNWKDYLGKRTSYTSYYEFFKSEIEINGLNRVLSEYLPQLLPGWVSSLTHAAIHLGWGLDIKNKCMITEGLAYLCFSFISCHPEKVLKEDNQVFNSPIHSFLNILEEIDKDPQQFKHYIDSILKKEEEENNFNFHPELKRSGTQLRIATVLKYGHPLIYLEQAWISNLSTEESWNELFYLTTLIYLHHSYNFVVLHLLTSLHALKEIAFYLNKEEEQECLKNYWIGMNCILFAMVTMPNKNEFNQLIDKYYNKFDDFNDINISKYWKNIIESAFLEKEEHNPKMVYVLRKMWEESGYKSIYRIAANQFTTTPGLPESFKQMPNES